MKAIGLVGFKKSGKTTLALRIARKLVEKKYKVAIVKHSDKSSFYEENDTDKFLKVVEKVIFITPDSTQIMISRKCDLKEILPLLNVDFLMIEGFKSLKYFPKILCIKNEEDKMLSNDGLSLFTVGLDSSLKKRGIVDYLVDEEEDLQEMITTIEKKAFILPDENCGKCGYQNCYELAQALVKGLENIEKCSYKHDVLSIKINGKEVLLNQFMSKLYLSLIHGMLDPLKGIDPLPNALVEIKANLSENNI